MSNELATTGTEGRPDWCPEEVWPHFLRTLVLVQAKVCRKSFQQISDGFGLPFGKVRNFYMSKKWRVALDEAREDLAQVSVAASYKAGELLLAALDDPEKAGKMTARDLSQVYKQQADAALNLSNGTTGPVFGGAGSFADLKGLISIKVERPEPLKNAGPVIDVPANG